MTDISFTRGDTYAFKFKRKNADGEIIETKAEKMWFSVKKSYTSSTTIIQKTLDEGITYDEEFTYHVLIDSIDTRELNYGNYVYDIQVMNGNTVQTITKGKFVIGNEVTTIYE